MPVFLPRSRQVRRWLRDTCPQGHMRTPFLVVLNPLFQETPQVVLGERDQKIQAVTPQPAQEPLAKGLGSPHRCFQDPETQVPHLLAAHRALQSDVSRLPDQLPQSDTSTPELLGVASGKAWPPQALRPWAHWTYPWGGPGHDGGSAAQ
jgi:hypothetical protein